VKPPVEDFLATVLSMCQHLMVWRAGASSLAYGMAIQRYRSRVCRRGKM